MELIDTLHGMLDCEELFGPLGGTQAKLGDWVWELDGRTLVAYPNLPAMKLTLGYLFNQPDLYSWEEVAEDGWFKTALTVRMPWGWQETGFRVYRKDPAAAIEKLLAA